MQLEEIAIIQRCGQYRSGENDRNVYTYLETPPARSEVQHADFFAQPLRTKIGR